jgi:hypothetical protein
MKAAAACGSVASLEVGGVKLRNILLAAVQKDFEGNIFSPFAVQFKYHCGSLLALFKCH